MADRPKLYQFTNCRILRDHKLIRSDLWVRNGRILNPKLLFWDEKVQADVRIDCCNYIISPGFIDVQINGAFGIDFSSPDIDISHGLRIVSKGLLQHGVTAYCPTIVTSSPQTYKSILPRIKKRPGGSHGATVLGVHLEGPYINPLKRGAHECEMIHSKVENGLETLLNTYGSLDNVVLITIAPEIPGILDAVQELAQKNVVVSLGHSAATLSQAETAVNRGASFITHLFNAMVPFHHRDPGLIGLIASNNVPAGKTIYYGVIADGVHIHECGLRVAHRINPAGTVLITDAMAAMGLNVKKYQLGPMVVEIRDGHAYLESTNTLAGSVVTMDSCVKYFRQASGCTVVETLEAATLHPALLLGIADSQGTLSFDTNADFTVLDDNLNVMSTWIAGRRVWMHDDCQMVLTD
ncbi:N-acetylglucosamine-6-phosphate deacetylase [Trichoplax sp. H2]|uniref:N-acetylglucosamine-6-phosphate deacetylase n=1 Tax=Trichoplax adhaerens TaxID=10228 RepID=B3RV02_TRIAD|nr:hypothetical protein TRIADDRAFT_50168 [Trichoplax adhaerens]EDV25916.1 hypothetical protein TRIADDRAFT_50168 [Trichoplax adhaerens]RDD43188.1 N-acetylglucosamine-6-phosphate deacetylase [Trichoplax sp. H2]|eukprot:XP_002111949.1 hypothetical protein TRIADDRAFT_50168 [Trichoplax adhaerens]